MFLFQLPRYPKNLSSDVSSTSNFWTLDVRLVVVKPQINAHQISRFFGLYSELFLQSRQSCREIGKEHSLNDAKTSIDEHVNLQIKIIFCKEQLPHPVYECVFAVSWLKQGYTKKTQYRKRMNKRIVSGAM